MPEYIAVTERDIEEAKDKFNDPEFLMTFIDFIFESWKESRRLPS